MYFDMAANAGFWADDQQHGHATVYKFSSSFMIPYSAFIAS